MKSNVGLIYEEILNLIQQTIETKVKINKTGLQSQANYLIKTFVNRFLTFLL